MTTCRRSSGARPERPATARKLGKIQTALVGSIVPVLTLIKTAKLNDVEPMAYLTDVITRVVNGHPNGRIDDLMPWAYAEKPILKAMV